MKKTIVMTWFLLFIVTAVMAQQDNSIKGTKVVHSKTDNDDAKFQALMQHVHAKYFALAKEMSKEMANDNSYELYHIKARPIIREEDSVRLAFARQHPESATGMLALSGIKLAEPEEIEVVYLKMSAKLQSAALGISVKEIIVAKKNTKNGMVIDFTLKDPDGRPVSLSDFKGKYVFIDFWSSNCAPCREQSPHIIKIYQQYKSRGFEVLGVSFDANKDAWQAAIKEDGLPWPQVAELKGWKNELAKKYQIHRLPYNFLVDPNGRMISKDLLGNELEEKLKQLFQ